MSIQAAKDFIVQANQDETVRKTARDRYSDIVTVGQECGFDFTLEEFGQAMRERKAAQGDAGGDNTTCQCLYEAGSCHSQTCQCVDSTTCQCVDSTTCQCVQGDSTTCQCLQGDSTTCQCVQGDSTTCQCVQGDATTCQCVESDSTTCQCVESDSTTCQCLTDGKKDPSNNS